jgi:phosphinothricin acetyltransferase
MNAADAAVLLRPSQPADIPAMTAIYAHEVLHGTASFELTPPDDAEMAARREASIARGYPHIVGTAAGEVVGYGYLGPYRPRPAYAATVENSVYVRRDCHGLGIGRKLLARLIEEAEACGYRQMVAVIGDSDHQASIRLHQALGFRHVGTLRSVGWKHGRWLDSVLMQRPIGAGDGAPPGAR